VKKVIGFLLAAAVVHAGDPPDTSAAPKTMKRAPQPIDFGAVDRTPPKAPALNAAQPLYGMFLFGIHGQTRVWAILDRSAASAKAYDVLYLDRNADGDLTQAGERFAGTSRKGFAGSEARFDIGAFKDPATGALHTNFEVTWRAASVSFRMRWRGDKITMGAYGPQRETYVQFSKTAADAPIFVPGYDRPFEFEHWMSGTLARTGTTDFKVFVGNRGSRRGAFTCVDDKFLPSGEYVLATLLYETTDGKRARYQAKLTERC